MRRVFTTAVTLVVLALGGTVFAAGAQATEWLYVLTSQNVRVIPGQGDAGRVVLPASTAALQFTDRPARQSSNTTVVDVLGEFGWKGPRGLLSGKVPNAVVAIDGDLSQAVEIRSARVTKEKVVLYVRGLNGPLTADQGSGAVFIDDAGTGSTTQLTSNTIAVANCNSSATSATVTFEIDAVTVWSGTLTPSSTSMSVPTSSQGTNSIAGNLSASFGPNSATVSFSGNVADNGSTSNLEGVTVASCTATAPL